jgi:ribosomal protein L16 Arg81 hydroxylase
MLLKDYFKILREGEQDLRMFFFDILREIPSLRDDFSFPQIGLKFFEKLPVMFIAGNKARVQMHFDIDYADIFLCHFGGRKKVTLFSPDQTPLMYHVPYSFSSLHSVDYEYPDFERYPALKHLKGSQTVLNNGDVLYIPPGWWHFIVYDEIGYSIAIRAFPRNLRNFSRMLRNLLWTRSVDGLMRMSVGQKWNDKNERLAVENTNRYMENHY